MYYNTHNEIVVLDRDKVIEEIIRMVTKAKYYSDIMDYTTHIIVNCETSVDASITGHFTGVLNVHDGIRIGLFDMLLEKLEEHNLNISACHDQSCDDRSNMLGYKQGFKQEYCSMFPAAVTL